METWILLAAIRAYLAGPLLLAAVLLFAGCWKVFEKAGEPGWYALVPFLNVMVFAQIAGKPPWWFVLYLAPLVQLIALAYVGFGLARRFGRSDLFGLGVAFLPFVFLPILGFGDAAYEEIGML